MNYYIYMIIFMFVWIVIILFEGNRKFRFFNVLVDYDVILWFGLGKLDYCLFLDFLWRMCGISWRNKLKLKELNVFEFLEVDEKV